ncbi:hypothetical protein [Lignipirellula cremea]|uniref:Alpha/beta hydrolase family protein n=1 Tax=Lignipirellula cremea TaxID=2528010 RepID=A0A518DKX8_9BACT|nr:hypothetical protein [Lignipirellula cremea]QDU92484.1 hypothetical protein Pla8534_02320 [Lignipirellula cremea]
MRVAVFAALLVGSLLAPLSVAAEDYPPGWLPIQLLDSQPTWAEVRKTTDRIQLYLPGKQPVRGVFVCFVFHSGDPRELADLWNFALVTVPHPFEYDLGNNDKRNGRYKLGHAQQDMGLLLRYLDHAAEKLGRHELATTPLVGWLGQNGSRLCADLYARAPERVLAWSDSFPQQLRSSPELTQAVPFAFAWEIPKSDLRSGKRSWRTDDLPADDLSCRASTYGFDHGIYSKYNFFMAYLDRCIRLRLPEPMPPPGEPVRLRPVQREAGWLGDFDPIGEWNPILPAAESQAGQLAYPCWLPDAYAAWMWRSYHSAQPDLKLTSPVIEYRKKDGKWGGPDCGLGYGGFLAAGEPLTFAAQLTGEYDRIEFHDGDQIVGEATAEPWQVEGVQLPPGLHALFVVGVRSNGERTASRPAFAIVKERE